MCPALPKGFGMQIHNGIRTILCLLAFILCYQMAFAIDFEVNLSASGDGKVCLAEDPLYFDTRVPDGWVGLEICVLQTLDNTGSWFDFQLRNRQDRTIAPMSVRYFDLRSSSTTIPIFEYQSAGPIGDVFRLIESGIQGPLRVYCVFVSPDELPDFELSPQEHPGFEKLNEIRKVLLADYSPHEIRELGVNRVTRPVLLEECDSVEK